MIKYYLKNLDWALTRATDGASGYDLRADLSCEREMGPLDIGEDGIIEPGTRKLVPTGLHLEMPIGVEAQIRSRSGLSIHHGVVVLNAPGTIDSDYRGELKVTLINLGRQPFTIVPGERIAQLVFAPVLPECIPLLIAKPGAIDAMVPKRVGSVEYLSDTKRGAGGHGSTGR